MFFMTLGSYGLLQEYAATCDHCSQNQELDPGIVWFHDFTPSVFSYANIWSEQCEISGIVAENRKNAGLSFRVLFQVGGFCSFQAQ